MANVWLSETAPLKGNTMSTYFVATVACYVLVDAASEDEARRMAEPQLYEMYAETRRKLGRDTPIQIHTVRLATAEEIKLQRTHDEMMARQRKA
jgi:ABC-type dipeptide/oligopeptide/nickel transport system permease component